MVMFAILGLSMRRALSCSERSTEVPLLVWIKMTSSSVIVNSSLLSVELVEVIGMDSCLT